MAQQTKVVLVDDLDGGAAQETLRFSLDSRHYEIDLSAENADQLRDQLQGYLDRARAVGPPAPRHEAAAIREWAAKNGYEVSGRGRIHREVIEAYRNAHKR